MATSKREPLGTSRDKATRMSPNIRPSSSESSGYSSGTRRVRSVPNSPDRRFGATSPSVAASGSTDINRPSMSSAGQSVSSRTMSTAASSIHGSRTQPFPGSASKPMLARAKSERQRPPVLSVPPSNSFKDISRTPSKVSPSSLLRNKPSPKPSSQRIGSQASQGTARGGRVQPLSSARSPGAAVKNRLDGATVSSKAKGVSRKAVAASPNRIEYEEDGAVQFKVNESLSTPFVEEQLQEYLPDPEDLMKSSDVALLDQYQPSSNQPEHQVKEEEVKEQFSEEKKDAGGNGLYNEGQDANSCIKIVDGSGHTVEEANGTVDKSVPLPDMTEVTRAWKTDDPKGNDAIEETKRKLLEERKSRVKALVGAFERVISFKE